MERGGSLEKQMEILVNLKQKLKQQRGQPGFAQGIKEDASLSCCGNNYLLSESHSTYIVLHQLIDEFHSPRLNVLFFH